MATRAAGAPRSRASCAEASQPAWRAAALATEAGAVLRAFRGARPAEPCLRLLKGRDKAGLGHTEKEPKQRYPQILTRSGPRPIVPAGRPLGPRSPQALPRIASLPASVPFPPRAPEVPKGRLAQAPSRRPEDPPPVQPARAAAPGGQANWPDSLESPQLPRPRGRVPPQPVPAPRTETLTSRPQIPTAPAHLEAGSTTPGPASDPGQGQDGPPCRRPRHHHHRRRRKASPATAPLGARPSPASDGASPRRPEPSSARGPGPFPRPSSPSSSPRRPSVWLSPPRPPGPAAGRACKTPTPGDKRKS
jgi:hypothetical protein